MAISTNVFLKHLRGTVGDIMTFKERNGKTIVCKKAAASKRKPSAAQLHSRELFKLANEYARKIYENPVAKEEARRRLLNMHCGDLYKALLKEFRMHTKAAGSSSFINY